MKETKRFDESRDLLVRRFIPAKRELLFQAWTQAEMLKKWWGPSGVTCTEAEVDLRIGGKYRIANQLPDGAIVWIHGCFEVIEPPALLQYTWGVGIGTAAPERVTVRFEPAPGGTEIVLLHENASSVKERQSHEYGWNGCLDGLKEFAAG